jgi:hypothetical protein
VTHTLALPAIIELRKISGASLKSSVFSVTYKTAVGNFIRS